MRISIFAATPGLLVLSTVIAVPAQPPTPAAVKNGTVIESVSGFPFETYEQWLQDGKSRYSFDEAAFRKKFPAENYATYKTTMHAPFETYEEWVEMIRRRFSRSRFSEAAFKKRYPPEDFQKFNATIECKRITYVSDGLKVVGFILRPRRTDDKRLPVIIYNRGGYHGVGVIDVETLYGSFDYLVSKGYVVVASQYRGCGGSEGQDELGGSDVNDVLNLIPVIESLPYADASRIGMMGWSRGGMMTYIALANTNRISAAVIGAAPTDMRNELEKRPEMKQLYVKFVPNYAGNKESALKSRSAVCWPERLHKETPILLLQGSADRRCDPTEALQMATALYEAKHPFRFVFFENGDHGLTQHEPEVHDLVIKWFDKYVRDRGR